MGSYSRAMATSLSSRSSGRLHIATGRGGGAVVVAVAVVVVVVGDDGGTSAGAEVGVSEKIFIAFLNCSVAERISMICFFGLFIIYRFVCGGRPFWPRPLLPPGWQTSTSTTATRTAPKVR